MMAPFSRLLLVLLMVTLTTLQIAAEDNFNLVILHAGDMNSRFEQTNHEGGTCTKEDAADNKCYGGFPRIAHKVKELKRLATEKKGPPVLFFTTGNTFTGTTWFFVHKWRIVTNLTNMLSIDAATLGNQEFDERVEGLVPFLNGVTYPVVVSNMDMSQEPSLQATPLVKSKVLTVEGKKIGIVGYITTETKMLSKTGKVVFLDELESVRKKAAALKKQGVDIIIALGHAGYATDLKIASEVPDVDVVVGGHSATLLYIGPAPDPTDLPKGPYPEVVTQESGKMVPVVHAYMNTKYLGMLNLTFEPGLDFRSWEGNPILMDFRIKPDAVVEKVLNDVWRKEVEVLLKKKLGVTLVNLITSSCRKEECNMANWITDAILKYHIKTSQMLDKGWNKASVVLLNGGALRPPDIDATTSHDGVKRVVTIDDLYTAMPYDDQITLLTMTGQHLVEALEWSVNSYPIDDDMEAPGAFLQVSGLRVNYDMCKPPGKRVTSVHVRCSNCTAPSYSPLDPDEEYGVLVNKYIAGGGDNFDMKSTAEIVGVLNATMHAMLIERFKRISLVYPGLEGRITIAPMNCRRKNRGVRRNTSDVTLLQCLAFVLLAVADVFFFV